MKGFSILGELPIPLSDGCGLSRFSPNLPKSISCHLEASASMRESVSSCNITHDGGSCMFM